MDNIERLLRAEQSFGIVTLKTSEATASNILQCIEESASTCGRGDTFLFYYSGHGGKQPDANQDESDGKDETLVAYDREIVDDELADRFKLFQSGVRIIMISDSCNSGTNYRNVRSVPTKDARPMHLDAIPGFRAEMVHLSGCRDGEASIGYPTGGAMTTSLCNVWRHRDAQLNWNRLYTAIMADLNRRGETQQCQLNLIGASDEFVNSRPFSGSSASSPAPTSFLSMTSQSSNNTEGENHMNTYSEVDSHLAATQKDLEHQVLRSLVEGLSPDGRSSPDAMAVVSNLRRVYQQRADLHLQYSTNGAGRGKRDGGAVSGALMTFAVKVITEELAKVISNFEFLLHPATGFVSFYNDSDAFVHVQTFDELDAVRWVPYEERNIAPKQAVKLTARGNTIHVKTPINGVVSDCEKAQAYLFDGVKAYPRIG